MQSSAVPDDSTAGGPMEWLTRTFLSQLQEQLHSASSLEELRAWANESIPSYQNSFLGMLRRQAQRNPPAVTPESSHPLSNALIKIIPCESLNARHNEMNPGSFPSAHSNASLSPARGNALIRSAAEDRLTGMWRMPSAPLPRQVLQNASLLCSQSHDAPNVEVSSEVMSALNMSFSWTSLHLSCGWGTRSRGRHHLTECGKAVEQSSLQSPNFNGDSIFSLNCMFDTTGTTPPRTTVAPPIGTVAPVGMLSVLDEVDADHFDGMPAFSIDGCMPGQRLIFSRPSARHTAVFRPIKDVQAILESLSVPFIQAIDLSEVDVDRFYSKFGNTTYVYVCLNVLLRYNFVKRYNINVERLHRYYSAALTYIRCRNPFHNDIRASDVVIAAHQFLLQPYVAENLSDEEIFAFLFASTVMNLGHLGAENHFLIDVRHPYVTSHSYFSPLQSVSLSLAFTLLDNPSFAFLESAPRVTSPSNVVPDNSNPLRTEVVWTHELETQMRIEVAQLLLSSDERNHQLLVEELEAMLQEGGGSIVHDRHVPALLRNILHASEFSYLFRGLSAYRSAAAGSVAEFYRQHAALAHIKRSGAPWCPAAEAERGAEGDSDAGAPRLSALPEELPYAPPVAAVRVLRTPTTAKQECKGGEARENKDSSDTLAHTQTFSSMGNTSQEDVSMSLPHLYAKEMQMVLLERLFLPYMMALSGFVPLSWEANMRTNLEWLRRHPADEFEREVEALLGMKHRVDAELRLCQDGFERRVLHAIFNA